MKEKLQFVLEEGTVFHVKLWFFIYPKLFSEGIIIKYRILKNRGSSYEDTTENKKDSVQM